MPTVFHKCMVLRSFIKMLVECEEFSPLRVAGDYGLQRAFPISWAYVCYQIGDTVPIFVSVRVASRTVSGIYFFCFCVWDGECVFYIWHLPSTVRSDFFVSVCWGSCLFFRVCGSMFLSFAGESPLGIPVVCPPQLRRLHSCCWAGKVALLRVVYGAGERWERCVC